MSWHRFEWEAFVTAPLLRDIAEACGSDPAEIEAAARPLLARLFEWNGGLPVCRRVPGIRRRAEIGRTLLHEALRHVQSARRPVRVPGYALERRSGREAVVRAVARLSINVATESEIAALPGIGPAVAARIAAGRIGGGYRSAADLAARVEGLGPGASRALAPRLSFELPSGEPEAPPSGTLVEDLRRLAATQRGDTGLARMTAALELLAARSAAERHPQAARAAIRDFSALPEPDFPASARIEILAGSAYYDRVRALIGRARSRIDVCMFHIAAAGARHPTGRILAALARARRRGVRVRVLVDRDRLRDPYHSNVINSAALRRMRRDGVRVRVDAPDRLLHSKFLVIDDRFTVLGSHNWTAGSYFGFDDLSLLVTSEAVRRSQKRRFEALWRAGETPRLASRS